MAPLSDLANHVGRTGSVVHTLCGAAGNCRFDVLCICPRGVYLSHTAPTVNCLALVSIHEVVSFRCRCMKGPDFTFEQTQKFLVTFRSTLLFQAKVANAFQLRFTCRGFVQCLFVRNIEASASQTLEIVSSSSNACQLFFVCGLLRIVFVKIVFRHFRRINLMLRRVVAETPKLVCNFPLLLCEGFFLLTQGIGVDHTSKIIDSSLFHMRFMACPRVPSCVLFLLQPAMFFFEIPALFAFFTQLD